MFSEPALTRAVALHERAYRLLLWMTDAIERGFIGYDEAHGYASLAGAAKAWIERHYDDLPPHTRPKKIEIGPFATLYATFLESSFELVRDPGERRYSPDAHCFCPMCSWMVPRSRLRTRRPSPKDKARARKLRAAAVAALAAEQGRPLDARTAQAIAERPELRETVALVAWARELIGRLSGVSSGPAALVLWRGFAWRREGSPEPKLELGAARILEAERRLVAELART